MTPVKEGSSQFKSNSLRTAHDEAKPEMTTAIDIRIKDGKRLRAQAYEKCNSKPSCLGWPLSDLWEKSRDTETRRAGWIKTSTNPKQDWHGLQKATTAHMVRVFGDCAKDPSVPDVHG